MKNYQKTSLIFGVLIWSVSMLSAESIWKSLYPYLTVEKNLLSGDITRTDRNGFETTFKQMNWTAAGLTFQKSYFSASVSLAAPWRKSRLGPSSLHAGVDLNLAFQMRNVYLYGGYFSPLKKEHGLEVEEITSPLYAGIGLRQNIKKVGLDFGFQASWGQYTDYWPIVPTKKHFASYALMTKISYDLHKAIHPFLSFSVEKLNSTDSLGFHLGLGIAFGKKMPINRAFPKMVEMMCRLFVKKPNIYLYPEKAERITVTVKPNGKITASDPPYGDGWQVTAHPDGSIDNTSGFLFYEALVTVEAPKEGWCVSSDNTASFFKKNLADYGFREKEIADFLEYWVPKLSKSPFYTVHPVLNKDLERICPLEVTPEPDQVLRLWFVFKPVATAVSLQEPTIPSFQRSGFVVTEWGGIMR